MNEQQEKALIEELRSHGQTVEYCKECNHSGLVHATRALTIEEWKTVVLKDEPTPCTRCNCKDFKD